MDDYEDEESSFPLTRYWHLILRHKGLLLLGAVAGGIIGFLWSLPQTPVYSSAVSIEIQTINEGFLGIQDVNPTEQGRAWGGPDLATHIEVIQSRALVNKAKEKVGASGLAPSEAPSGRLAVWRRALGFDDLTPDQRHRQAINMAASSVSARPSRDSRIVRISAESTDPSVAARFANTMADEFIAESIEARWEATQYTEDWLDRQLEELRIKLEEGEDRLQAAAHATGLVFTSDTSNVAQDQLQQLQEALSTARADRIAKQSKYELATTSPAESLPDVLDSTSLGGYQTQLSTLRQELANLTTTYTDEFPQVKKVKAQIAEIEKTLSRESRNILTRIENEYQESLRREKLLQADYENQSSLVSDQARKSIQYNILKREVETTRQLYDNLLQKGKEARLAAAMRASPVRVLDEAVPSNSPVRPDHYRNATTGLFLGLLVGVVFVIGREKIDRTVRNPGDAELYLSSPELGFIPSLDYESNGRKVRIRLGAGRARDEDTSLTPNDTPRGHALVRSPSGSASKRPETISWTDQKSWAGECVQATLTSILFSGTNGHSPRQIVVTSGSPGEGKSTVTSNLAIAIAEINQSVLVIDADMRRPRQHQIFEVSNEQGLSDLLRHPAELDADVVQAVAQATAVPGVVVLPAGPGANSVSNLLHSQRTRELLKVARQAFDWVLIDTPPMSQLSDARLLARLTDGAVFVLKAGSTSRDSAALCEERLRKDGSRLIGVILNEWNPNASPPGYGKYREYASYKNYYERTEAGR